MREYLRSIPERPLSARRRFVVVATVFSFTLILLLWFGILALGRRPSSPALSPVVPTAVPLSDAATSVTPRPPATSEDALFVAEPSAPAATPVIDVGQISTSLLNVFAPPKPTPATTR